MLALAGIATAKPFRYPRPTTGLVTQPPNLAEGLALQDDHGVLTIVRINRPKRHMHVRIAPNVGIWYLNGKPVNVPV